MIDGVCPIANTRFRADPTFFLRRAVRLIVSSSPERVDESPAQMVDKIWYDWQHKTPKNQNLFAGGSIDWLVDASLSVAEYPNGAPLLLNICEDMA